MFRAAGAGGVVGRSTVEARRLSKLPFIAGLRPPSIPRLSFWATSLREATYSLRQHLHIPWSSMLGSLNVERMYLWESRHVFEAGGVIAGIGEHETPTEIE